MTEKGYIQIYTGNGKGKTTAALGLIFRALGAGFNIFIGQFLKGMKYSELKTFEKFSSQIEIHQFGSGCFVFGKPTEDDIKKATEGFELCYNKLISDKFDVVVLDEINVALSIGLISLEKVLKLMADKPEHVELIMTGRNAMPDVIEKADLVTEMREIKHYYKEGVEARVGIEK